MDCTFIKLAIGTIIAASIPIFLWKKPLIAFGALLLLSAIELWKSTKAEKLIYGASFLGGPLVELGAIILGAWVYTMPAWYIPLWLMPLWAVTALNISRGYDWFKTLVDEK